MRTRKAVVRDKTCRLQYQGQAYIDFSSNDYLGMSQHPEVVEAAAQALKQYGVGSGGSAMITGYSPEHQALEHYLADWLGYESCLLFGSGFAANTGVIETLMAGKSDLLIQDKLNHASLIDGGINCQAKSLRFHHNDIDALNTRLQSAGNNKLVVTEGVFSMDGDTSPLRQIAELAKANGAAVMVDDAHGLGVLGEQGKGTPSYFGLSNKAIDIHMATFGKAVGTTGAFVAASSQTIEYLLQFCRHSIYSTAMPPAMAAATLTSLKLIAKEQWRRDKLCELINHFKQKMAQLGLPDSHSKTAIQPVVIGDAAKVMNISDSLKASGIWLTAIRPPTVPQGTSRLRVTLSCNHEIADIDVLFEKLEALL